MPIPAAQSPSRRALASPSERASPDSRRVARRSHSRWPKAAAAGEVEPPRADPLRRRRPEQLPPVGKVSAAVAAVLEQSEAWGQSEVSDQTAGEKRK